MGLSEYDKKVLEQLERDLLGADDAFSRKLAGKAVRPVNSGAKLIAGAMVALVGLSLLVFAAIIHLVIFGVLGFLVALIGLLIASAGPATTAKSSKSKPTAKKSTGYFENRWNQRRDQP
jgi:hypothetical protein